MENLRIITIKDGIIAVKGKYHYQNREVVRFENNDIGIVLRATDKQALIALIENNLNDPVKIGQTITPTGKEFSVNILDNIWGSIVDISGNHLVEPLNKRSGNLIAIKTTFVTASPIYTRDFVNQPLHTGTLAIDSAIPIGLGQRELIIGDRQTGKTAIALNMIYSQISHENKVIYVAIGKKRAEIVQIHLKLREKGVLDKTLIVAADADTTSISKYLVPYSGVAIAEHYQAKGENVLIIYDDLTAHADAYREVALLTGAAPGRDAYPGDIFYQHSRLLERAGRFTAAKGGGSITAIPIVETQAGDISGYIPTNVISITDGQIFTSKSIFNSGIRPAIDIPYSVSRISSAAQTPWMRKVSRGLKLLVAQYNELQKVATFSSTMAEENSSILAKGLVIRELFKQQNEKLISYNAGSILLALANGGYLNFFARTELSDSLQVIKRAIVYFLKNDILGKKLDKAISDLQPGQEKMINKYLTYLILPVIKFHLVSAFEIVKTDPAFQEKFADVRDDGPVIWKQMQRGNKEGLIYDYNLF